MPGVGYTMYVWLTSVNFNNQFMLQYMYIFMSNSLLPTADMLLLFCFTFHIYTNCKERVYVRIT